MSNYQEIAEPLFHLKLAMEQLSASQTFRCILATVLAIGNFLNGCKVRFSSLCSLASVQSLSMSGSHTTFQPAKARGFELSYLGKLSQVRDTHTRQPLLHHVCVLLMQLYPQSSDLYSDITAVTKAGKVSSCVNVQIYLAPDGSGSAASESKMTSADPNSFMGIKGVRIK